MRCILVLILLVLPTNGMARSPTVAVDPLTAWNAGAAKSSIVAFVKRVTEPKSVDFVPVPDRIAVFDNDGTLWTEGPLYTPTEFSLARVRALAPTHPGWTTVEPFKSILAGEGRQILATMGDKGYVDLINATYAGMTNEEFVASVKTWVTTAQQPRFKRPYVSCVYLPMLQLLKFLRSKGFKTYIVSGSDAEFIRPWSEQAYGIPPEQVIGTRMKLQFEVTASGAVINRLRELDFYNDGSSKPIGIQQMIGRRPLAAFGNSDGDLQMLQWATAGNKRGFALYVHHTDAEREYAYDRDSDVGRLSKGLDEARAKGWTVVDMKKDWRTIFPPL